MFYLEFFGDIDKVEMFTKNNFPKYIKYGIENNDNITKIYPKDIRTAGIFVVYKIRLALELFGIYDKEEYLDFPSIYTNVDFHWFIPKDYGLIKRKNAVGEPTIELSEKYYNLVKDVNLVIPLEEHL